MSDIEILLSLSSYSSSVVLGLVRKQGVKSSQFRRLRRASGGTRWLKPRRRRSSPFATVPLSRFQSSDRIEQLPSVPGIL